MLAIKQTDIIICLTGGINGINRGSPEPGISCFYVKIIWIIMLGKGRRKIDLDF